MSPKSPSETLRSASRTVKIYAPAGRFTSEEHVIEAIDAIALEVESEALGDKLARWVEPKLAAGRMPTPAALLGTVARFTERRIP